MIFSFFHFLNTAPSKTSKILTTDKLAIIHNQPEITCSKLTMKTLEQGVKYVQS